IGKHQSAQLLDRIGLELHLALQSAVCGFSRLSDAVPFGVVCPSVIRAPQPLLDRVSVRQINSSMRADMVDQSDRAAQIPEQYQILSEDSGWDDLLLLQIGASGDRLPITPHELAT